MVVTKIQHSSKTIKDNTEFYDSPEPFPSCVLEASPQEVQEYYSPKDFWVGGALRLMGRSLRLYDCDSFTRSYYESNYPDVEFKTPEPPKKEEDPPERVRYYYYYYYYCIILIYDIFLFVLLVLLFII